MKKLSMTAAALLLAACAAPVFAQDQAKPDNIVLETKVGSVMTSTGGDFQSADAGKQLVDGESMMLNEGAKAKVVYYYDNGKRKCVENYAGPNTFVIDDNCGAVAAFIPAGTGFTIAVIGGAALAASLLAGVVGGDTVAAPISAGAR